MKCELCKKKEASVHFKQIAEGSIKELYVCEDCASANGFDVQAPMSLTNFLFGVGVEPAKKDSVRKEDRTCKTCGMRSSDFRKHSRLGCSDCYDSFVDELRPVISNMQKGSIHAGKVPSGARVATEISRQQLKLRDAIARQDYEEAATLRDSIKALQAESRQQEPSVQEMGSPS